MPHRRRPAPLAAGARAPKESTGSFRQRFDALEARRAALLARLASLNPAAQSHPGHKRAIALLNSSFRKAKLAQRIAVLNAADWLINVLEQLSTML